MEFVVSAAGFRSELLRLARSVPEVQNFHDALSLMDLVVDQYRGVHQCLQERIDAPGGRRARMSTAQIARRQ